MKIVDSHTHIGTIGGYSCDIETLLKAMNSFGAQTALVSDVSANEFDSDGNYIDDGKSQVESNLRLAQICEKNDLKALFWVRPCREKCGADVMRFLKVYKDVFKGLKAHPAGSRLKFTAENYRSCLEACRELRLPICVHTGQDGFSNTEYVYEAALEYPDVNFIAVHMDAGSGHRKAMDLIRRQPNLYGDSTLVSLEDTIEALRLCGSGKILFGSDAAVFGINSYERYVSFKQELPRLFAEDETALFFHGNAERIFFREEADG